MRFDHVAIEVSDFDARVESLVGDVGMTLVRMGLRHRTGQRIAMLGDGTGVKIELIESETAEPTFAHVAFRAERPGDVDETEVDLVRAGWSTVSPAHDLGSARARTSLLADEGGLHVQVIAYEPDSPDLGASADTADRADEMER